MTEQFSGCSGPGGWQGWRRTGGSWGLTEKRHEELSRVMKTVFLNTQYILSYVHYTLHLNKLKKEKCFGTEA